MAVCVSVFALGGCGGGSSKQIGPPGGDDQTDAGPTTGQLCSFLPSNFDLSAIDFDGVGDVVLPRDQTIETDLGGLLGGTGQYNYREVAQSSGPKLGIFAVKSLTIPAGVTASAEGGDPLVIVALGDIVVDGTLLGSSVTDPYWLGPGAQQQSGNENVAGAGSGGGAAGTPMSSAGGAGYCGAGGDGASLTGSASKGGASWGTAALVPLVAGSDGATGGVGPGGNGGGAIQLTACGALTVAGLIDVGGQGGTASGVYDSTGAISQQASGGGSGGAILLEGASVAVTGTLAANGGGGGGATHGSDATSDGQSAPGGTTSTDKAAGGGGGAGATADGQPGQSQAASTAGAGGGAAGRIRINAKPSRATLTGMISPSTGACTTQGTL